MLKRNLKGVLLIAGILASVCVGGMVLAQNKLLPQPQVGGCVKVYSNLNWTSELEKKLNDIYGDGEWTVATQGNGYAAVIHKSKKCPSVDK